MSKFKQILAGFLLITAGVAAVGIITTVLVLVAYGLGSLWTHLLPLDTGQATLLALIALIATLTAAWRVLLAFLRSPGGLWDTQEDEEWLEEDWDEEEEDMPAKDADRPASSIPPWRQSSKPLKYEAVNRNDPCPCGSGRKYKNCHGRSTT